jgi:hypothetical protein
VLEQYRGPDGIGGEAGHAIRRELKVKRPCIAEKVRGSVIGVYRALEVDGEHLWARPVQEGV